MDTPEREHRTWQDKNSTRTVKILGGVSISIVVFLLGATLFGAVAAVRELRRTEQVTGWDPLGSYPQQTTERDTYTVGDDIRSMAIKCADVDVTVTGSVVWQSIAPPGIVVTVSSAGVAQRPKGCTQYSYVNPTPPAVADAVDRLGPLRFIITGVETPYDETDPTRLGVQRPWRTNVFTLLPKEPN